MNNVVYFHTNRYIEFSQKAKKYVKQFNVDDIYSLPRHSPVLVDCILTLKHECIKDWQSIVKNSTKFFDFDCVSSLDNVLRIKKINDKYIIYKDDNGYEHVITPEDTTWIQC